MICHPCRAVASEMDCTNVKSRGGCRETMGFVSSSRKNTKETLCVDSWGRFILVLRQKASLIMSVLMRVCGCRCPMSPPGGCSSVLAWGCPPQCPVFGAAAEVDRRDESAMMALQLKTGDAAYYHHHHHHHHSTADYCRNFTPTPAVSYGDCGHYLPRLPGKHRGLEPHWGPSLTDGCINGGMYSAKGKAMWSCQDVQMLWCNSAWTQQGLVPTQ